jgi:predicted amidophosphoribosyltransferase
MINLIRPFGGGALLRQLFALCRVCRTKGSPEGPVCETCEAALIKAPKLCALCWLIHDEGGAPEQPCAYSIRSLNPAGSVPAPVASCYIARGLTHEFLKAWKSGDPTGAIDRFVNQQIKANFTAKIDAIWKSGGWDWIVPIPQPSDRQWELHGGSAVRFAQIISEFTATPWVQLLQSHPEKSPLRQRTLTRDERFLRQPHYKISKRRLELWHTPHQRLRILLVDDIITTGRTLISAAEFLQNQGIEVAAFLSLGYRPPNLPKSEGEGRK